MLFFSFLIFLLFFSFFRGMSAILYELRNREMHFAPRSLFISNYDKKKRRNVQSENKRASGIAQRNSILRENKNKNKRTGNFEKENFPFAARPHRMDAPDFPKHEYDAFMTQYVSLGAPTVFTVRGITRPLIVTQTKVTGVGAVR